MELKNREKGIDEVGERGREKAWRNRTNCGNENASTLSEKRGEGEYQFYCDSKKCVGMKYG